MQGMKPKLPDEISRTLPTDLLHHIYSFVPHLPVVKPKHSPSLQRELERIQRSPLLGKNEMYLRGFEEFILK